MKNQKVEMEVSQNELIMILDGVVNPTFCEVEMVTVPTMNKGGRGGVPVNSLFGRVTKHKIGRILIGISYENRIENEQKKEGLEVGFKSEENKVGGHVNKCILHNEKLDRNYLFHEWFKEVKPKVEYLVDGRPMDEIEAEIFKQYTKKTDSYSGQGLDRPVQVLSVCLDNVKYLTHNGTRYILQPREVPQMV